MEINVSAYMSSIRPYRWIAIHEMLKKTKLNFEIVIVGPNEPDFDLPEEIKFFKLLSVAGAYWRGNEKNKMLVRIYGTAFESQESLDKYLNNIEEAKKIITAMKEGKLEVKDDLTDPDAEVDSTDEL